MRNSRAPKHNKGKAHHSPHRNPIKYRYSWYYTILKLGLFCGERAALDVFLEHSEHIGKFIGPADPALISGASKYVNPGATRAAIVPAFIYLAA